MRRVCLKRRPDESVAAGERGQGGQEWAPRRRLTRRREEPGELHQGDVHREEEHERTPAARPYSQIMALCSHFKRFGNINTVTVGMFRRADA